MKTKIFLKSDVLNVGMAGEIVSVSEGFATNYLVPRKLGIRVTPNSEGEFQKRLQKIEKREEVIKSKSSMLAERIKSLQLTVSAKMHADGKLYGTIRPQQIMDELSKHGIAISKSMVIFNKQIKEKGSHQVTIKLSSNLQPAVTVKVVPEE